VGEEKVGVLDALFRFQIEDFHAAIASRAMTHSRRRSAVDAHLGKSIWEIFGLDLVALFGIETRCPKRILNHHSPYGLYTGADVITAKWSSSEALSHFARL
jgi:hypothetical protein